MNAAQEYADHAEQHAAALARIAEGDAFLAWFETCLTPVDTHDAHAAYASSAHVVNDGNRRPE